LVGFREIRELLRVVPTEGLAKHMARIILVARKPERPSVRPYPLQQLRAALRRVRRAGTQYMMKLSC
jgi:hypothetical protein